MSDLANGPKMFRGNLGPKWGPPLWRLLFFFLVVLAIVSVAAEEMGKRLAALLEPFGCFFPASTKISAPPMPSQSSGCMASRGSKYGKIEPALPVFRSETRDMRIVIVATIGWLTLISKCPAQNCVVSGGNNLGTIIQNCGPTPAIIPLRPALGEPIVPVDDPQGTFRYQIFVRIVGPIDVRVVACGDDVIDVNGRPYQSGIASVSVLNGLPKTCVGKQLGQIVSGTWRFEVISKSKDKPVQIQAVVGDFVQPGLK